MLRTFVPSNKIFNHTFLLYTSLKQADYYEKYKKKIHNMEILCYISIITYKIILKRGDIHEERSF